MLLDQQAWPEQHTVDERRLIDQILKSLVARVRFELIAWVIASRLEIQMRH